MNCRIAQPLISEYIDNTLSARETLELDKHLADCNECARLHNEMRRTVGAMQSAHQFEVSVDFMAKLQARLADVEPLPARKAWFAHLSDLFRPRMLPVWGTAAACCSLVAFMLVSNRPVQPVAHHVDTAKVVIEDAKAQNVALAATNPLEDLSAANLDAHPTDQVNDSGMSD